MNAFKAALSSLTLCAVASAQLQFNRVATVDLNSTSSNANPEFIGSNPSAVAWDGSDLIVAGFNGGTSAATVSLIRVSNVLGSPSFGATFGALAATPASRGYSGIAVDGGKVAAAHDNGAATATGVALYDASTGSLLWQIGTTGTNARGMAGIDFDPGFGGVDLGVNFLEQGSGRRRLVNTTTGTFIYTSANGAIINLTPLATGWRDHAFDPATGDLYTRVNNDLSKHTRTGGNAFSPNARIVDVTDVSTVAGQNVEFLDTAFGSFLIYNDRPSTGTQSFSSAVRIVNTSGTPATFNFGPSFSPATAAGFYDFAWDTVNDRLAVLDFANRKVYVFELCPNIDTDGDGTVDCIDGCPVDPLKIAPGACGCGVADTDTDGDGTPDCIDGCPSDPLKTAPGNCGCGVADTDTDGDGTQHCSVG
ncbi:MAG: hypothetical protein NTV21_08125, partial [Planctomycetota bacterium]|nr:hypothetical protein [Planctomycetota bacterium]